ncbi:MarR family transcriptional regulator [Streptomyces longispororuber]|uniref:MarR family transcriptional regulator n=1 Tax=Streptomyces longispororuber TaxID=68230 RepID=UPI00210BA5BA|nr:MarR family transcriptional regulator [Streptomyces longispororuber]MCQ4210367.1 MarR family transcriptional regulator [Streptomyces longispororuber]
MSGTEQDGWGSSGRAGCDLLAAELAACEREEFTGRVRVAGTPGGTLHLRGGLVVAVESPGSPGPEALLLRSGRVSDEQWAELVREAGGSPWPAAGLIAREYAGAAQLRVVCLMAMRDAVFAIVAGQLDDCERDAEAEPAAPSPYGESPWRLLQDADRRLAAVETLACPVSPDRERTVAAPGAEWTEGLTALRRELLAHADGRRSARDLAFLTGRGVYAVTVEVARMLGEGLLERVEEPPPIPLSPAAARHGVGQRLRALPLLGPEPDAEERAADPEPPAAEEPAADADDLPRRSPGASGINESVNSQDSQAS